MKKSEYDEILAKGVELLDLLEKQMRKEHKAAGGTVKTPVQAKSAKALVIHEARLKLDATLDEMLTALRRDGVEND